MVLSLEIVKIGFNPVEFKPMEIKPVESGRMPSESDLG
jgi:hypothetical protein